MRTRDAIKLVDDYVHAFCNERKKWVELIDEEIDESLGEYPWERELKRYISLGIINIDKPPGPTSHEIVAWVKRMFGLKKAGHSGTLEPALT